MTTNIPYVDRPCDRCGSKRKVAKTWTEKIATFSGSTKVEYSQIVCTNKECQRLFDESLEKEAKQKQTLKLQKEQREKERMANSRKKEKTPSKIKSKR